MTGYVVLIAALIGGPILVILLARQGLRNTRRDTSAVRAVLGEALPVIRSWKMQPGGVRRTTLVYLLPAPLFVLAFVSIVVPPFPFWVSVAAIVAFTVSVQVARRRWKKTHPMAR